MVFREAFKDKIASRRVFTRLGVTEKSSGILTKLFAEFSWPSEQCAEPAKSPCCQTPILFSHFGMEGERSPRSQSSRTLPSTSSN